MCYNVRESTAEKTTEQMVANLRRNLDPKFTPAQDLILDMLLNSDSFQEVYEKAHSTKLTSACYINVGGCSEN